MWSIGVTAYLLLCGDTPFNGKNRQQLFRRISCDEPAFPDDKWGHISDDAVEFVQSLLTKDPAKRLSAAEALSHRWLADNNSMTLAQYVEPSSAESDEILDAKRRVAKSSKSVTSYHSTDMPPQRAHTSRERSKKNRSLSRESKKNRSVSRERIKNRSISRDRIKNRSASRTSSRGSRSASRDGRSFTSAPPPPPKPQAPSQEAGQMDDSGNAMDENARLLDVIKNQDAKIEKLERMVKRMLEPEGAVHEC